MYERWDSKPLAFVTVVQGVLAPASPRVHIYTNMRGPMWACSKVNSFNQVPSSPFYTTKDGQHRRLGLIREFIDTSDTCPKHLQMQQVKVEAV